MDRPRLRKLERIPLSREGEAMTVLRDPLGVAEDFAIESDLEVVLDRLDGRHSLDQVRQSLLLGTGLDLDRASLQRFSLDLDERGLLEGDRFLDLYAAVQSEFLHAASRPARFAGSLYPADARGLEPLLSSLRNADRGSAVGVITPHQPPLEISDLLVDALQGLPAASELDLVIVLATDHRAGLTPYCITAKAYETPMGSLRAPVELVRRIEKRLPWICREEIRHRTAMASEIAALQIAMRYGAACPPVLFVLCGQTALAGGEDVEDFAVEIETITSRQRVLLWACAELSHAGPAFGGTPLSRDEVSARDLWCVEPLRMGRPDAFARRCGEEGLWGRPSGAAALQTFSRALPIDARCDFSEVRTLEAPGPSLGWIGAPALRFSG